MALYFNGNKIIGSDGTCSADKVSLDDTDLAYEADDVQEALEKVTKSLTWADYTALTTEEKNNGTIYLITDVNGDGQSFQPVIYSEEEREVGVWTNGKPLYEKTLEVNGTFNLSNNAWTDIISIPNIDIISELSYYFSGISEIGMTDGRLRWSYSYSTEYLRAAASTGTTITNPIITIRYTKTTDTAGSGTWTPQGVPAVHYSTDEQVVGTWIDGSIVYEKTFDLGSETSIPYNSWYNTGLSGFNKICGCFGMNNSGAYYPLNASIQSDTLHLWSCRGIEVSVVRYLTIQYTKSSS